nr:uncharacterized protein LOC112778818 [Arachis hypogaea]
MGEEAECSAYFLVGNSYTFPILSHLISSFSRWTLFSSALSTQPNPPSDTTAITTGDHRRLPALSSLSSLFLPSFSISPQSPVRYLVSVQSPTPREKPQCNPTAAELCAAATPPLLSLSFHSSPFTNAVIECMDITGSDDTDLVDELPDLSCFAKDEISRVGMRFEHLKLA